MLTLLVLLAQEFKYDAWESWSAFGVGAMVEHRTETPSGPMTVVRTIESKTKDLVTLRVSRLTKVGDKDVETPEMEHVKKPGPDDPKIAPSCSKCRKVHPKDVKEGKQKLKVGDAELDCVLLTSTVVDCDGKKVGTLKRWLNKDVPGWLVRMETLVEDIRTTMECRRFSKK